MEQYKTKVTVNKVEKTLFTSLPKTPFFIRDNEAFEKTIYMVIRQTNGMYSYVNIENGDYVAQLDDETYVLNRINCGNDTLLASELVLSNHKQGS